MPYRFKPSRPLDRELQRIIDKQLRLAIEHLRGVGNPQRDSSVHEARRHVKKVRAVIRLVEPALGGASHEASRRMREVTRLLGPIADGESIVSTVASFQQSRTRDAERQSLEIIHAALVERAMRIDREAAQQLVLPRTARLLREERARLGKWSLTARGFPAVAPGLQASLRRARRSMRQVAARPTPRRFHRWRRRVKDVWFQLRLLEGRCAGALAADVHAFEELDGCLGEYHNVVIVKRIIRREHLVPYRQTALGLRMLNRYQDVLCRRALKTGARVLRERPRDFVKRVERAWQNDSPRQGATCRGAA